MRFYNRDNELADLKMIENQSLQNAQMTFLIGRRRIGKTKLLFEATKNSRTLYFFVSRKAEPLLCKDFIDEIQSVLNIPIYGEVRDFATIFKLLMEYSKQETFTLIIDEFQEFFSINDSVYSDMQNYWDRNKDDSHINLILCGSIYSLMHKIFEDSKEPLFGRATHQISIHAFSPNTLKRILADNNAKYTKEDLLALYTFTGGIPKYVEQFIDNKAYTYKKMIALITQPNSLFLSEGKTLLIEEFGKEYTNYYSILSCIASGFTSRTSIENILQREIGGYLTRLERDFGIIKKQIPLFSKSATKNVIYTIDDTFLRFWFRFIYKYARYVEIGAYDKLSEIIQRDYPTFSGTTLENYFRDQFIDSKQFTTIGGFWDRKGENEIDLIALDELHHHAVIAEIKRKKENINLDKLRMKTASIYKEISQYDIEFQALSMEDM